MLDPNEQFRKICESARFIRPVSVGMFYRTSDDMNDGFGILTASCREKTPPRAHEDSVVKLWKKIYRVKTFCHFDVLGIELQITSTSGGNTNAWVVISRGSNRNVYESRYKDPEYSPGSLEETDYGSMLQSVR